MTQNRVAAATNTGPPIVTRTLAAGGDVGASCLVTYAPGNAGAPGVETDVGTTNPLPVRLTDGAAFVDIGTTLASILTAISAQSTAATVATQAATNHADLGALLTATQALATQATLATASSTLSSILAKIIAGPATETTLAAAKADLDTLLTTVATASAQATGNASLGTLVSSVAALVTANHTDLAALATAIATTNTDLGLLATASAQATGNTSLASIKTDLDTLVTNIGTLHADVSTAALQTTGNAALATLHTDLGTLHTDSAAINTSVGALTTANHADLLSLATALATLHTDSSAILAKQPSAPALDATLTGGTQIAIAKGAAATGAAVSGNPVYVGGKDGSGNAQPVAIGTHGGLVIEGVASGTTIPVTEASASSIATSVSTIAGAVSASRMSVTDTRLPAAFGAQAQASCLPVTNPKWVVTAFSSFAAAGVVVVSGAGYFRQSQVLNNSGASGILQGHNSGLPSGGAVPLVISNTIASGGLSVLTVLGEAALFMSTDVTLAISTTANTFTAGASTAFTGYHATS